MKKWFTLLLVVTMMLTMIVPTFAAVTGEWIDQNLEIQGIDPKIIKDEEKAKMEKVGAVVDFSQFGSTEAGTKGHCMAYEYNVNLWNTILVKQDNDRNPNLTEYIVYKMEKNIAGFEFLTQCCAGLGDPLQDISVFISKNGKDGWTQVKTQATYYEFDRNFYIHWDKAYWFKSTLTNAQKIPAGYKYLKIQFNPCNDSGDVPWNVAIDSVKIIMGSNVEPVTIPEDKKFVDWETINAERESTRTTAGNNNGTTAGNNNNKTTANNGGGNKTTAPVGGGNKTTAPTNSGNKTTLGGNVNTTTATNDKGEVITDPATTATNADGEVITDPTTATNADGEIITDPTNNDGNSGDTIGAEDGNQNTDTNADPVKKGNALPWIIGGIVVLAGAAVAAFFLLKKKQG